MLDTTHTRNASTKGRGGQRQRRRLKGALAASFDAVSAGALWGAIGPLRLAVRNAERLGVDCAELDALLEELLVTADALDAAQLQLGAILRTSIAA